MYDRITGAFKRAGEPPPGFADLEGATYDRATRHALFIGKDCIVVEAPTTDLTNTTSFDVSQYGASNCSAIEIGRDGNLYIASMATDR